MDMTSPLSNIWPNMTSISWMGGVVAVACMLVAGSSENAYALTDNACKNTQVTPTVKTVNQQSKIKLNRSKTSAQITRFAHSVNSLRQHGKASLLGLAYTEFSPFIIVNVLGQQMPNGRFCIRLNNVDLTIKSEKNEIFIAKKYAPGTCAYRAIMAHEKKHMSINSRVQKEYAVKAKKLITREARRLKPYYAKSVDDGATIALKKLNSRLKPLMVEFWKVREKANNKIDTPASYKRVRRKCANW
jgi:hypothetical protein